MALSMYTSKTYTIREMYAVIEAARAKDSPLFAMKPVYENGTLKTERKQLKMYDYTKTGVKSAKLRTQDRNYQPGDEFLVPFRVEIEDIPLCGNVKHRTIDYEFSPRVSFAVDVNSSDENVRCTSVVFMGIAEQIEELKKKYPKMGIISPFQLATKEGEDPETQEPIMKTLQCPIARADIQLTDNSANAVPKYPIFDLSKSKVDPVTNKISFAKFPEKQLRGYDINKVIPIGSRITCTIIIYSAYKLKTPSWKIAMGALNICVEPAAPVDFASMLTTEQTDKMLARIEKCKAQQKEQSDASADINVESDDTMYYGNDDCNVNDCEPCAKLKKFDPQQQQQASVCDDNDDDDDYRDFPQDEEEEFTV